MNKGFIMLDRELLDEDFYLSERFTRPQAFIDLCFQAAYKDKEFRIRGNKVELKRGQVAKSLRDLSIRWKWSVNTVSKFLKELQEDGYIDTQKTPVNQVITIKKYLIVDTRNDTQVDTQINTQNDTPIIKDNKDNKDKTIEEKDTNVSSKKNDYQTIVNCWNEYNGKRLGKVTKLTDRRKKSIKKALVDNEITQEQLMSLFQTLPLADSWLYNPNKQHKNWKPDFDWWMANTNGWLTKALEGKVHTENPQAYESIMLGEKATYHPVTDGDIHWSDNLQCYLFVGMFFGTVYDGYNNENRPDGATVMLNNGQGTITWNSKRKVWEKK